MTTALSVDLVLSQVPNRQKPWIDEELVAEVNKLAENPEYGEEFLENYIDHLNVLGNNQRYTHAKYLKTVKFFSLVEAGDTLTDAYIKVFPERYEARRRHRPDEGKEIMRGEASRFNATQMLADIRKAATIPVQLIHRHLLHEAILEQANLMRTAKSEMVKQKAAETLIRELKPQEDQVLQVQVNDGSRSIIEELRLATERMAAAEYQAAAAGVPMKVIAESNIIEAEYDEIPADIPAEKTEEKTPVESKTSEPPAELSSPGGKKERPAGKRWTL